MTPDACRAMARYNRWMNEKVYAVCAKMTDEERKRDRGAFFKSIHGTLNHLLVADKVWMARFTGVTLEDGAMGPGGIRSLDQELHAELAALRDDRAAMDSEILAWTETLTAERLSGTFRYQRRGQTLESPLWSTLLHVFNHQTHHRGQVTTLLSQAGHDVGVTDLVAMLRDEATNSQR